MRLGAVRYEAEAQAGQLDRLFEALTDGLVVYDPDGRMVRTNAAARRILGMDAAPPGAYARPLRERTPLYVVRDAHGIALAPEDWPATRILRGEALTEREALDVQVRTPDGREAFLDISGGPLRDHAGRLVGAVCVYRDQTERTRLERERARLLERERAARAEAEASNAGLRAMQALTDAALSHLALDDLLRELLGRVTDVMGVDSVAILLLDEDSQTLTLRAARGPAEEGIGRVRIPVGDGFSGRIVARKAPLVVDDTSTLDLPSPWLRETLRSIVGVPLLVAAGDQGEERLAGVVHVGSTTPRRFTEADVRLLQRAVDRIGLAIGRARLYAAERDARARAEAALARATASEAQATERAERLRAILETMADGVAVYDAEGRPVQLVNRAYRELYAVDRAPAGYEALTTRDRAHLLDMRDAGTGAPLPFEGTPVARALRGEVVTGPDADVRVLAFDGRELEVNSSAAPLRDREGRVAGAVLVLRDVTWRRRLERERAAALARAQASEAEATERAERLNTILETMADGVGVCDQDGRLIQANRAGRELLAVERAPGFDALPFADQSRLFDIRDAATGGPLPPERHPVARALRGEVVTGPDADVRVRALDGRALEVNASAAPLRDRAGRVVGAVSVLRDVTWRRRLERERAAARADELAAREASRRLEEFLATAAHDLRSPLTATLGYLALAQRQTERLAAAAPGEGPALSPALVRRVEAARGRLEDAGRSGQRLARLLTLLFDTAALRAGKLELHLTPCDLAALVREQVAALRVAAPGRAIRLRAPAAGGPVPVEADADRIAQVATNYVTNALKYAPPDRPVDVSVEACGGRARVAVRDAGPGLPEAERARVWELFHRAPGVAPQGGGTPGGAHEGSLGLGLYISQAIVEAHGGRVGVRSAVGEGSTFWFTLPLAHAATA